MFSSINPKRLQIQLKDQREKVLRYLEQTYGANVIHIALLPNQLIERWKKLGTDSLTFTEFKAGAVHLVTWEAILAPYKERGLANYWTSNLELALQDFCTLASRFVWDANSDGDFTGAEIVMRYEAEDFPYKMMGCRGGLDGTTLSAEIESGHWKTRSYSGKREQQAANQLAFYKRLHPKDC